LSFIYHCCLRTCLCLVMIFRVGLLLLCFTIVASEEEEEIEVSPVSMAIAATWLGAITLAMAMFYCIRNPDPDMRKYTYDVVHQTISIFCAVLFFQTWNTLLQKFVIHLMSVELQVVANILHMLFWYVLMQVALGFVSGAIGKRSKKSPSVDIVDVKCVAVLLSHITGFASINAWTTLQELHYYTHVWEAFAVVIGCAIGQYALQHACDAVRKVITVSDSNVSIEELKWDEEARECEWDIIGLALSFNSTQVIRYAVSGVFPNREGEEQWKTLTAHSDLEVSMLMSSGIISLFVMVLLVSFKYRCCRGDSEVEEDAEAEDNEKQENEEGEESGSVIVGVINSLTTTMTMMNAWAMFYAAQWFIAGKCSAFAAEMELYAILTIFISVLAFASIRLLDKFADLEAKDKDVEASKDIRAVITSLALLIGFAWEQCFDQAVHTISAGLDSQYPGHHLREISSLVLTSFAMILVAPAWRRYIAPMVVNDGWVLGFVVDDEHLEGLAGKMKEEHYAKFMTHVSRREWYDGEDVSNLVHKCLCGNWFKDDAIYCRKCGRKRPKLGATIEDDLTPPGTPGKIFPYDHHWSAVRESREELQSVQNQLQELKVCHEADQQLIQQLRQTQSESDRCRASDLNTFNARMETMLNTMAGMEARLRFANPELGARSLPDVRRDQAEWSIAAELQQNLQCARQDLQAQDRSAESLRHFNTRMGKMLGTLASVEAKMRSASPDYGARSTPPLPQHMLSPLDVSSLRRPLLH